MLWQFAGVVLLLVVQVYGADENPHMVVFNKELRCGMEFRVSTVLFDSRNTVTVVTMKVTKGDTVDSALAWDGSLMTVNIAAGDTRSFSSLLVPCTMSTYEQYYLRVHFNENSVETSYSYELTAVRPLSGIFLETDKPIYKPGDLVRFRLLMVDKDLKLLNKQISVLLKDPAGNTLVNKTAGDPNSADNNPVLQYEFMTYDISLLGEYMIEAFTTDRTVHGQASFNIEKYVIPKYDTTIVLDKQYAVDGDNSNVTGTVKAIYTHGGPVEGTLTLSSNGNILKGYEEIKFDGQHLFKVPVEAAWPSGWRGFGYYDRSLSMTIEATVTDKLKNKMSDVKVFTLYSTDFMSTVPTDTPPYFKGSPVYSLLVYLTDPTGSPLHQWNPEDSDSAKIKQYKLWYMYRDQNYKEISQTMDLSELTENVVNLTIYLKEEETMQDLQVWFEYLGKTNKERSSSRTKVELQTYVTTDSTPLHVELVSQDEAQVCFKLTPFKSGDIAFYQILNNYNAGEVLPYTQTGGYCFEVARKHAPKTMIVGYKSNTVTPPDEKESRLDLVTANLVVLIPWATEQQVSIDVSPKKVEPGENVTLTIRTTGASMVYYLGMDKGLSYLADAIEITTSKMMELVESYQIFAKEKKTSVPNPIWDDGPIMMAGRPVKRKKRCMRCPNSYGYLDAEKLLEDSGLAILTNLYIFQEESVRAPIHYDDGLWMMAEGAGGNVADKLGDGFGAVDELDDAAGSEISKESLPKAENKVRKEFPEVWLWNFKSTSSNGVLTFSEKVPDTITNWTLSAFAFNSIHGLGVAEKQEVSVFKDFFLSMNLPYSIVRNEVFLLELMVFNYNSKEILVELEIQSSSNYSILGTNKENIKIGPNSSGISKFRIKMITLGNPPIKATATAMIKGLIKKDIVERPAYVKAEGREVRNSVNFVKNTSMSTAKDYYIDIDSLFVDPYIVPGSIKMMLYVTGDIMGPVIKSVGEQIRMPYGCGEQNIKSLTPGLFSALYLQKIDRLAKELEDKVKRVCGAGYRKELSYKHTDGSYSAFGESANLCSCGSSGNVKGSTWLTAYVLKMFSLLYIHDMTYVDFKILTEAFQYMGQVTRSDCDDMYFIEEGKLIHIEMMGGSGSRFGFTAFVLISILTYRDAAIKVQDQAMIDQANVMIDGATNWLINHIGDLEATNDAYQMSIVAYALSKAGSGNAPQHAASLLQLVKENLDSNTEKNADESGECFAKPNDSGEYTDYCTNDGDCMSKISSRWQQKRKCCKIPCAVGRSSLACTAVNSGHYGDVSASTKVETYGYILMAALQLHSLQGDAKWKDLAVEMKNLLVNLMGPDGTFESTQDTAVALEALASFSMAYPDTNGADFAVKAIAVKENEYDISTNIVIISSANYTLRAEEYIPVPVKPDNLKVKFASHNYGTAYINMMVQYNVKTNLTNKPIIIDVKPGKTVDDKNVIEVCWKKNEQSTKSLGSMVVIRAHLPSGAYFDKLMSIDEQKKAAERYELSEEDTTIALYYMEQGDQYTDQRCPRIVFTQNIVVEDPEPSLVSGFDYYKPENSAETLYMLDQKKECMDCPTTGASAAQGSLGLMISLCLILMAYIHNL